MNEPPKFIARLQKNLAASRKLSAAYDATNNTERMLIVRNMWLGCAAIDLAIILSIVQLDTIGTASAVATIAAAIAMPLAFMLSVFQESYFMLGVPSFKHLTLTSNKLVLGSLTVVTGLLSCCAIAGVLWIISPLASKCFFLTGIFVFFFGMWWNYNFAVWWAEQDNT